MTKASTGTKVPYLYLIGIGSNRSLSRPLPPKALVAAAFIMLNREPMHLMASSGIFQTRPLGPSARTYSNAAALIATPLPPLAMLDALQAIERQFGRKRYRRWGARTLDLDILLWSGGRLDHERLTIPHPAMHARAFVLTPLNAIAPRWRDHRTGLNVAHLAARIGRPKPVDRGHTAL